MTATAPTMSDSLATPRRRLLTPGMLAVLVSAAGTSASLYLLLTSVPLHAAGGPAGGAAAGLTSAALMLSSVAAELFTPALVGRFGYRLVFGLGVMLLGAPALALPLLGELALILAISVLRGIGFGITVVVGAALAALLSPSERRGESLGLYGIASAIPAIVGLPLGVWLVDQIGNAPVFVIAGLSSVAMVAILPWFPGRVVVDADATRPVGVVSGLRSIEMVRPAISFAATALAGGIVVTFLPLASTSMPADVVVVALLAQATAATIARWWAGRVSDRSGAGPLLVPGLLTAAAGVALVVAIGTTTVIGGMLLFGAGFGVVQSASLNLMLDRLPPTGYRTASAVWSIAYDGGWGLGSVVFGLIVAQTGYPLAFGLTAAVIAAAVVPAWSDRRAPEGQSSYAARIRHNDEMRNGPDASADHLRRPVGEPPRDALRDSRGDERYRDIVRSAVAHPGSAGRRVIALEQQAHGPPADIDRVLRIAHLERSDRRSSGIGR